MTIIHADMVGDKAVLPRIELEQLLELARLNENVELISQEADVPTSGLVQLAEQGGAFDFLNAEDLYTVEDLKVRYR